MKRKTIEATIRRKIDDWANSITQYSKKDKALAKYALLAEGIKKHYIVSGGCIVSMLQQQEPNDFDVYFDDVEFCAELAEFYLQRIGCDQNDEVRVHKEDDNRVIVMIKSSGMLRASEKAKKDKKKNDFIPLSITDNAITLSDGVQFILRFTGSPETIHKNFDFAHTKCYQTSEGLVLDPLALECILTKTLKYTGSKYPLSSIIRTRKFIRRGWTISAGEMLKIMYDVSKLDLENIDVLKDQLIGVDVTYFHTLITALTKGKADGVAFDRTYLCSVIDLVFDEPNEEDHNDHDDE